MGRLLLIRHGHANFGAADYDQLLSVGEEQSQRLGSCGEYTRTWPGFRTGVLAGLQRLGNHGAHTIWAFISGGPIAVIVNALMQAPSDEAADRHLVTHR
jgi:hypothetical protein